ncbi:carboxymuconolactone decarboxylase family protein [Planctomonas sp. JC2975]|uniref:carboxymuconolactone decarboxylase family protein n=1 Tax=Planctomonas sp. JC2975 TaxID=2729626 RepID=UPI0014764D4C|nr:carboxymuconolactone decarboxylase family protein [Planctomonas sp. JC2975]NNC12322.1 carboxymuconolactone decarboxylase family protein [Planctomonas sp. JC2975]
MTSYFDTDDKRYTRLYKSETPDILAAFNDFNSAVFAPDDREIPLKYRELIAVAVAITTQCAYCIDGHSAAAVRAGATRAELAETAWVAAALKAGGAFAHGRLALKLTDPLFEDAGADAETDAAPIPSAAPPAQPGGAPHVHTVAQPVA